MSIDEIKMLNVTERIMLVEEIWDSIAKEEKNVKLSEDEKKVLDGRLSTLDKDMDNLMTWDEIKNKIRA